MFVSGKLKLKGKQAKVYRKKRQASVPTEILKEEVKEAPKLITH